MNRDMNAEEVQKQHLDILGPDLGPVYHSLYNDCVWLHVKWRQYVELYGIKHAIQAAAPGKMEAKTSLEDLTYEELKAISQIMQRAAERKGK